jgi:hypothetical protein
MKETILLMVFVLSVNVILSGNSNKSESPFRYIKNDVASGDAVLIFSVKTTSKSYDVSGMNVLFSHGSVVYSCPMNMKYLSKVKENKTVITEVFSFTAVVPGNYDLNLVEIETSSGQYSGSIRFPFQGSFKLETGTVNYLGEINVDMAASACSLIKDEKKIGQAAEKFAIEYPVIFNSAGKKITAIALAESYPCETNETILVESFSQNNGSWNRISNNDQKILFTEGAVKIDNQGADSCLVTRRTELPDNFDLSVETTWTGGETNKAYGLLIGNEETQCLKFSITSGGYFAIFRWDYGKPSSSRPAKMWSSPSVEGWKKSGFIHTSTGEKNILRVQKTSWQGYIVGVIAFYINDKLAARNIYYVTPPMGGSGIQFKKNGVTGMFSYGKQNVSFSSLRMSTLK